MSVARAQREIDSREFSQWMAYHKLHPLGNDDWRAAMLAWVVASVHGAKMRIEDFFRETEPPQPKSVDALRTMFEAFVGAHNQRIRSGG